MPVMQVGPVRVRVRDRLVDMAMRMTQVRRLPGMRMKVMVIVVAMLVLMLQRFVRMAMDVTVLGEQADRSDEQYCGYRVHWMQRLAKQHD